MDQEQDERYQEFCANLDRLAYSYGLSFNFPHNYTYIYDSIKSCHVKCVFVSTPNCKENLVYSVIH